MDYNKSFEDLTPEELAAFEVECQDTLEEVNMEVSTLKDEDDEFFLIGELGYDGYLEILELSKEVGESDLMKLHSMVQQYGMEKVILNFSQLS